MSHKLIGKMAPAFNLLNQVGEKVALKDFKGKQNIILYFYPKAMTPGCTNQACGIRDLKAEFVRYDTVVLGVSPDEPERLMKFYEKENLNFDLLSDPEHEIAEKYGVWGLKKFMGKEYMGILRQSFIIGSDGRVKHHIPKVNTKTHHQETLDWIVEHLFE